MLLWYYRGRLGSVPDMVRRAPWHILLFALGMFLVVFGLHNAGLTRPADGLPGPGRGAGNG